MIIIKTRTKRTTLTSSSSIIRINNSSSTTGEAPLSLITFKCTPPKYSFYSEICLSKVCPSKSAKSFAPPSLSHSVSLSLGPNVSTTKSSSSNNTQQLAYMSCSVYNLIFTLRSKRGQGVSLQVPVSTPPQAAPTTPNNNNTIQQRHQQPKTSQKKNTLHPKTSHNNNTIQQQLTQEEQHHPTTTTAYRI